MPLQHFRLRIDTDRGSRFLRPTVYAQSSTELVWSLDLLPPYREFAIKDLTLIMPSGRSWPKRESAFRGPFLIDNNIDKVTLRCTISWDQKELYKLPDEKLISQIKEHIRDCSSN